MVLQVHVLHIRWLTGRVGENRNFFVVLFTHTSCVLLFFVEVLAGLQCSRDINDIGEPLQYMYPFIETID